MQQRSCDTEYPWLPGTIHNILSRTGKNMGTKALHIMESIKASDLLRVDGNILLA